MRVIKQFHINKTRYKNFKIAAAGSAAVLVLGGMAFLQPFSFGENSYADSTNTDISVNIGETIMLPEVSQEAINLTLEPNVNGDFESASVNVRMSTNHVSGYTLTMSTEGTETALTSSDFDSYKIDALGSKTSATDFANLSSTASINKWGYATDNNGDGEGQTEEGYYYGITNKDNPTTIKITDSPTNSSETNVTFATKGKDLAAGTYSNTVVFSAVANAVPETRTLDDFEYMQDVDADGTATDICENSTLYSDGSKQYTLKDKRDNSEYTIRKLADGKCWMVNNLKLSADTLTSAGHSTKLDASDTDLTGTATFTVPATSNANWGGSSYAIAAKIANSNNADYGMYYNWWAAVASTDNPETQYQSVDTSICPKGWDLPKGQGAATRSTNNDWWAMLVTGYGLKDYYETSSTSGNPTNFTTGAYNLPFSGYWSSSGTSPQVQGTGGSWWSSTVVSESNAYGTSVYNNGGVGAGTGGNNKRGGFSVRCVLSV